jgi:hypothetical protein
MSAIVPSNHPFMTISRVQTLHWRRTWQHNCLIVDLKLSFKKRSQWLWCQQESRECVDMFCPKYCNGAISCLWCSLWYLFIWHCSSWIVEWRSPELPQCPWAILQLLWRYISEKDYPHQMEDDLDTTLDFSSTDDYKDLTLQCMARCPEKCLSWDQLKNQLERIWQACCKHKVEAQFSALERVRIIADEDACFQHVSPICTKWNWVCMLLVPYICYWTWIWRVSVVPSPALKHHRDSKK